MLEASESAGGRHFKNTNNSSPTEALVAALSGNQVHLYLSLLLREHSTSETQSRLHTYQVFNYKPILRD